MKSTLLIVLLLSLGSIRAEAPFDYQSIVQFVNQRAADRVPADECIYVLGPRFSEETLLDGGKESSQKVPYCRVVSIKSDKTLNNVVQGITSDHQQYQVLIYHAKSNTPSVKIVGEAAVLADAQYPMQSGDVVYITPLAKK